MTINFKLAILILAVSLSGQVYTGKIIGGKAVAPHGRPYMVRVELHMGNGKTKPCGGFLLNAEFVMTAAHCQAKSLKVLLGYDSPRKMIIPVKETFPHKDYNATFSQNDIMLLKLSSKANFSKDVSPIALAGKDDGFLPKSCSVSGWGKTNTHNSSRVLMEANVTIIDSDKCPKDNSYCSLGETGPNRGDSGGPLVCEEGKAYGVVSGSGKMKNGPTICCYTKIPDYRDWIDMIMKTP